MEIVSWPIGVNRTVLSETTITVGQDAVSKDSTENGSEMTLLKSSGAPDQFAVVMYFSNSTQDSFYNNHIDSLGNHVTEWQAFLNWFKYTTMMGQKGFYFHKIDDPRDDVKGRSCVYKIMSSGLPKGTPEGTYYKVTMTWAQVFLDAISVSQVTDPAVDSMFVQNGFIDVRLEEKPENPPSKPDFSITSDYYAESTVPLKAVDYDGNKSVVLYFDEFNIPGTYKVNVRYGNKMLTQKIIVTSEEGM